MTGTATDPLTHSTTIPVLINGAASQMGQVAVQALTADKNFTVISSGGPDVDLATDIRSSGAQIVLDFGAAGAIYQNTLTVIKNDAHPIISASGLTQQEITELQQQCYAKKLGGIIVPNFSLGAVLMMQFAVQAARYFSRAEIIEAHHDDTLEVPSATAIRSAELIQSVRNNTAVSTATTAEFASASGSVVHSVPVHAIRLPGYFAQHTVVFAALGETLSIKHDMINYAGYGPGILLACKKVLELQELKVGLEQFVGHLE